eukprot:COSAG02_NODE_12726_length_1501_cov_1.220798_3_plen_237_part_00
MHCYRGTIIVSVVSVCRVKKGSCRVAADIAVPVYAHTGGEKSLRNALDSGPRTRTFHTDHTRLEYWGYSTSRYAGPEPLRRTKWNAERGERPRATDADPPRTDGHAMSAERARASLFNQLLTRGPACFGRGVTRGYHALRPQASQHNCTSVHRVRGRASSARGNDVARSDDLGEVSHNRRRDTSGTSRAAHRKRHSQPRGKQPAHIQLGHRRTRRLATDAKQEGVHPDDDRRKGCS